MTDELSAPADDAAPRWPTPDAAPGLESPEAAPRSETPEVPQEHGRWLPAAYAGLVVAIIAVAAIVVSQLDHVPARTLRVDSGSMRPTLAIGQIVRVDTGAYASAVPRIGDIVAFHAPAGATGPTPLCGAAQVPGQVCAQPTPSESGQIFIKRVVAGPGDTISVLGGAVVRNGTVQREPFVVACAAGVACNFPLPIQVPAGEWFLMGDDRGASDDSRYWGPVPTAWIVGRVVN